MGLTSAAVCGVVPVAAIVPILLPGAYRHYRGITTTVVTSRLHGHGAIFRVTSSRMHAFDSVLSYFEGMTRAFDSA